VAGPSAMRPSQAAYLRKHAPSVRRPETGERVRVALARGGGCEAPTPQAVSARPAPPSMNLADLANGRDAVGAGSVGQPKSEGDGISTSRGQLTRRGLLTIIVGVVVCWADG